MVKAQKSRIIELKETLLLHSSRSHTGATLSAVDIRNYLSCKPMIERQWNHRAGLMF